MWNVSHKLISGFDFFYLKKKNPQHCCCGLVTTLQVNIFVDQYPRMKKLFTNCFIIKLKKIQQC